MSKLIFSLILTVFLVTSVTQPAARAAVIDTSSYLQSQTDTYRTEIEAMLSRTDVQEKLVSLGVSPEDARDRVAALTDEELAEFQQRINELPAGSNLLAVLGAVLVVLIVLELVGVTNVFTRI